jgi:nucleotide-binding universal stress UspA family protein
MGSGSGTASFLQEVLEKPSHPAHHGIAPQDRGEREPDVPQNSSLDRPAPAAPPTDGPRLLVVGVDDSETSFRAAAYAAGIARRQGARLIAAHVLPHCIPWAEWLPDAGLGARAAREELAREVRAHVEEAASRAGVPLEFRELHGDPCTELARLADEQWADAVLVGASTRTGHRLAGSLAVRLVRHGRWPVTVVP